MKENKLADFVAKMHISLKESYETECCLKLLVNAGLAEESRVIGLYNQCVTIRRMLV